MASTFASKSIALDDVWGKKRKSTFKAKQFSTEKQRVYKTVSLKIEWTQIFFFLHILFVFRRMFSHTISYVCVFDAFDRELEGGPQVFVVLLEAGLVVVQDQGRKAFVDAVRLGKTEAALRLKTKHNVLILNCCLPKQVELN